MDTPTAAKPIRINRWLPYWAVFQADVQQTVQSWVYRTWVFVSLAAAIGYLLYHVGVYQKAGIIQFASTWVSDLLRWTLLGSTTLIVVLTAGTISAERGTMADSVLSRGISRHQYFLGKLHARLVSVLGTFLAMGALMIAGGFVFLHEDLSLAGSLMALATGAALLAVMITCGVTVSALSNSTVVGIAVLWFVLYGGGFVLALLPDRFPFIERSLNNLPNLLRGYYDGEAQLRLMAWAAVASGLVAAVGLVYFARRDV